MELTFATRHLRDICTYPDAAINEFDASTVEKLHNRLSDLKGATFLCDLPFQVTVKEDNSIAIGLDKALCICAAITQEEIPTLPGGKVDLAQIYRLKIVEIKGT